MNKIILLLFGFILFCEMNWTKVLAQTTATAVSQASVTIVDPLDPFYKTAQVKYVNDFSQIVQNSAVYKKPIVLLSEKGKLVNSVQNIAIFSITGENINSFSISLPSQPVILKNSKNTNTLQITDWKSTALPGKGDSKKNGWIVNLGASVKLKSVDEKPEGTYSGSYMVTFIYN